MRGFCEFLQSQDTWTIFTSRFTTSALLMFAALVMSPDTTYGKSLKFTEDAMCIPIGDPIWATLGIHGDVDHYIPKKKISVGPAEIPPGCKLAFGYSSELTSQNDNETAEKRVVTSITNCEFKMAGVPIQLAKFDLEGCLDGMQHVTSPKPICNTRDKKSGWGQHYFDGGFLRCAHKPEEP